MKSNKMWQLIFQFLRAKAATAFSAS